MLPPLADFKSSDVYNKSQDKLQSQKALKYFTRNFFDTTDISGRGIFFNDGFGIPSERINQSTEARFGSDTTKNVIQNLPALPLTTTGGVFTGQGTVEDEKFIRPDSTREPKQCQPVDTQFHNRHFGIFTGLPVKPNSAVENVVQKGTDYRQGVDTRHMNKKRNRS